MKQRMQGLVMGVLVMTLIFSTATVFAATTRTIEVTAGNVRTTLFGQEFVVRDDQGAIIESFTYSGRVFVPVDVITHAMDDNVQWDAVTSTLNFGTPAGTPPQLPEGRPLVEVAPFFERSGNNTVRLENVNMRGEPFTNAITFAVGTNRWSHHNLAGQFTVLTGTIGRIDGTRGTIPRTIRFIGDGAELDSFIINENTEPTSISVDVTGVRTLRIEVVPSPGGAAQVGVAFANAMLH